MLTFGFNLDDPNTFGIRIHHMIKLGLSIDSKIQLLLMKKLMCPH
jgi:hypothetical protein